MKQSICQSFTCQIFVCASFVEVLSHQTFELYGILHTAYTTYVHIVGTKSCEIPPITYVGCKNLPHFYFCTNNFFAVLFIINAIKYCY